MTNCPICNKQFSRSDNLARHIKSFHQSSEAGSYTHKSDNVDAPSDSDTQNTDNDITSTSDIESDEEHNTKPPKRRRKAQDNGDTHSQVSVNNGTSQSSSDTEITSQSSLDSENSDLITASEIKRLRTEVAWAEIGERTLTQNQLMNLVKELEDSEYDEIDGNDVISEQGINFLREMLKSADGNGLYLSRLLYFIIIKQLSPFTDDVINEDRNDSQLPLLTSQLQLYSSQLPLRRASYNKIDIEPESMSSSIDDTSQSSRSSQSSNTSDPPNPNIELVSPNEIKRLLAEITWADIGERTLTQNQLTGLVRDLSVLPSDSDAIDDETEITDGDAISDQAIVFLREMLKSAEGNHLQLSRQLYFNIIQELY